MNVFRKNSCYNTLDRIDIHLKFGSDVKTDDATDAPRGYTNTIMTLSGRAGQASQEYSKLASETKKREVV